MKINKLALAIAGCLLSLATQTSQANSYTYNLDWSDVNNSLTPGSWGTVTILMTSANTANVTFTAATGYGLVDSGIADLNVNASSVTVSGLASGFSSTGSGNVDGLGVYSVVIKYQDSSTPFPSVSYTITDNSGSWGINGAENVLTSNGSGPNGGFFAAAHIYQQGSTFYVGADGQGSEQNVPDGGATIMMLGSALAGLGIVARRVRKS